MSKVIIHVQWNAKAKVWRADKWVNRAKIEIATGRIKAPIVRVAVDAARDLEAFGSMVQLFIHIVAGNRIAKGGERTYPRSSDPRRSRG